MPADAQRGYTPNELARLLRVSPDKVRARINAGELRAINTVAVLCSRPRWVITSDALAAFERRRAGGPPPKAPRRRRRAEAVDYYPD